MLPFYTTMNKFAGNFFSLFLLLGIWYTNTLDSGYLPLNSNRIFDNKGMLYNVSRSIDNDGLFNQTKYERYSPAFLTSGNIVIHIFSFSIYTATLVYSVLYHWHEIKLAFIEFWQGLRSKKIKEDDKYEDVHNRLMSVYKEGMLRFPTLIRVEGDRDMLRDNSAQLVVWRCPPSLHCLWYCRRSSLAHVHHAWCGLLRYRHDHRLHCPYRGHQSHDWCRSQLGHPFRVHRRFHLPRQRPGYELHEGLRVSYCGPSRATGVC